MAPKASSRPRTTCSSNARPNGATNRCCAIRETGEQVQSLGTYYAPDPRPFGHLLEGTAAVTMPDTHHRHPPSPGTAPTTLLRVGAAVIALLLLAGCSTDSDQLAQRQAEVAERGADVMPFDLDATTHTFTPTGDGGIQTVTANDPDDADQIALIRAHLREERDKFSRGDFSDPAAIHGHDMDGVAELQDGYDAITVTFNELPDGAQLTYRTGRPDLVEAIHAWFSRQLSDHGAHAQPG